jgi:S-DNA-T family DNA segregation ATPase FtsK/SpoIIIE
MISTLIKWTANVLFSLLGWIIVWAIKLLLRLACWSIQRAVTHPRTSLALTLAGVAVGFLGWQVVVAAIGVAMVAGSVWKAAHRRSFDRWVGTFVTTWWRRWWHYSRQWHQVMTRCGLAVEVDQDRHVPELRKVASTRYWDRLELRMQVGQEMSDFEQAAGRVRHAFGAERVTVREIVPGGVGVDLMRRDPLREGVPAALMPAATADIDYSALPVGLTEHLVPWMVSVVGGHTAVSGSPGAGKAGLIWNCLRCLAPAIADGSVRLVMIDPKAMELKRGRALAAAEDYAVKDTEVRDLLKRLTEEMADRTEALGIVGENDHTPTPEFPLVLILIDEFAPLLAYWSRGIRDKIHESMGLLLSQGRSAGFIVLGCIQEPTKDVFTFRDLFGRKIGLRLPTESHTDAALVEKAVDRGAECHRIPESLPGVGFQLLEGASVTVRGRLGYVGKDDIAELVAYVAHLREAARFADRRVENVTDQAAA